MVSKTALNFLRVLVLSANNVFDFFNIVSYLLSSSSFIVWFEIKIFVDLELNVLDLLTELLLISWFSSIFLVTSVWDFFFGLGTFFLLSFPFFLELSTWRVEGTVTSETFFVPSFIL